MAISLLATDWNSYASVMQRSWRCQKHRTCRSQSRERMLQRLCMPSLIMF